MTNRLACIGIHVADAESFGTTVEGLLAEGATEQGPGASALTTWLDPSGAAVVASLGPGGDVECVMPTFFGTSTLPVVPRRLAKDASCSYCDPLVVDVVDAEGELLLPMAVQIDDLALTRPRIPTDQRARMAVTAFAEELAVFANPEAFDAWQADHPVRYAAEAAVPIGLFDGDGDEVPEVLLTGVVLDAELRVNDGTGEVFTWLSVRSLPGVLDVVTPVGANEDHPPPGAVVHGSVWMVGRLTGGLLPGPSPRPRRRFGVRRPGGRRR